ncbi:ABC transporter G family member 23-like [Panonychus citri]|uniref:ABC transporter G family member 23-like n=1 Tax=Panonychus citri TaxID=50023 RepID=UPI002307F64F|nr:ABC transporter G family member 23-like [Panonychus citri]
MLPDFAIYGQSVSLSLGSYLDPTPILTNLHLTIPKGCIYGLIGPSGCGKTTLQKCIMGVYKPDHGVISVFGLPPGSQGSTVPGPSVGYMPQDIALDSELTVREQLTFLGRINNLPNDLINSRIDEITTTLEIGDLDKRSGEFSGGQQRRISLACTLIHQPSLYLLDEPTVGSDIVLVHKIWNYLKHLRDTTGATIIISTHYIEEVNSADLFGFMSKGTIIIQDSPSNFREISKSRTLEEAILKEYTRLYALPKRERSKSLLAQNYSFESTKIRPIEQLSFHTKVNRIDINSNSVEEAFSMTNEPLEIRSVTILLMWRYLLRWKVLMVIPFVLFYTLAITGSLTLFNVYGLPMKQLSIGVVNHDNHSEYLNNITNFLASDEFTFHFIPDEIIARQTVQNGSTSAYIVIPDNWDYYLDQRIVNFFPADPNRALVKRSQITLFQDTTHVGKVLTIQSRFFQAIDSLMKNVTRTFGMNSKIHQFFDTYPVFESLDRSEILAPRFNFLIRLYLFFVETFTILLLTAWFRHEINEPVNERFMALELKPYHFLIALIVVATFFLTISFICIFSSFIFILHLPSPTSWFAVTLITISVIICGICKSRFIGINVKSIIGCVTLINAYNAFLWLLGCVAWPYEGIAYFMQPLTIMIPHLDPGNSMIRMTIYGDSIWTPQVYHGIGVATIWMIIHLIFTFILARKW